jgi:hypothetical protein
VTTNVIKPSIVRLLARAYADGKIDRRRYVLERRRLIDGIISGAIMSDDASSLALSTPEPPPPPPGFDQLSTTVQIPGRPDSSP